MPFNERSHNDYAAIYCWVLEEYRLLVDGIALGTGWHEDSDSCWSWKALEWMSDHCIYEV